MNEIVADHELAISKQAFLTQVVYTCGIVHSTASKISHSFFGFTNGPQITANSTNKEEEAENVCV